MIMLLVKCFRLSMFATLFQMRDVVQHNINFIDSREVHAKHRFVKLSTTDCFIHTRKENAECVSFLN